MSDNAANSVSFLEKYAGRSLKPDATPRSELPALPPVDRVDERDAEESCGCFGWLRGQRDRAIMLELRKKSGNIKAIPYSWIESVEFDPSAGITIRSSVTLITIKGRNLNGPHGDGDGSPADPRLFAGLCRHRVPWVTEGDRVSLISVDATTAVIDSIEWA